MVICASDNLKVTFAAHLHYLLSSCAFRRSRVAWQVQAAVDRQVSRCCIRNPHSPSSEQLQLRKAVDGLSLHGQPIAIGQASTLDSSPGAGAVLLLSSASSRMAIAVVTLRLLARLAYQMCPASTVLLIIGSTPAKAIHTIVACCCYRTVWLHWS